MFQVFVLVVLCGLLSDVNTAPKLSSKLNIDPNYVKIVRTMKKLQPKMSKDDIRLVTAVGLVQGALEVQRNMEKNLTDTVADLILNLDTTHDKNKIIPKIENIERIIERDRHSIEMLGGALDLARKAITEREYHMDMKKLFQESSKRLRNGNKTKNGDIKQRLENLKKDILEHVNTMHTTIDDKANATISYLERMRNITTIQPSKLMIASPYSQSEENVLKSILADAIEQNLVEVSRREDVDGIIIDAEVEKEAQMEEPSGEDSGGGPGGLVGLIASLSGGEEGSDVGALLGAVTGLVMNLFGPGGLDIQSLIASGTSLLSGLLAGDRNFGTVLGEYVGTAVDGLSGGGGAINNGQFFGNFLGTLIAQLSADPEDDDQPPKPHLFLENFISSFTNAKNKVEVPESEGGQENTQGDSESFGFIKHVVRAVVGGVTSFILNASMGSSSGSSQGSAGLLSSSSHPKNPDH